ncbi:hypothetical protein CRUP_029046 [Coryphaenoides rupestris]|nr:hypothetical protein CRUP_029046 [Coryphaenoides rupestris]
MKQYVEANVSPRSNTSIQYFLKMWSSVSETLIFIFLGVSTIQEVHMWSWPFVCATLLLCLLWRASGEGPRDRFPPAAPCWNAVTFRDQFIIAYGGLRGAICFSLVFLIDDFPKKRLFITTTIVVILFTVFVQGMTIKPLVELLEVKKKKGALPTVSEEIHSRLLDHLLAGIEDVVGYWGQHYWKDKFEQFNKKYLRRFLIREEPQARSSILRVYEELERREQRGEEEQTPITHVEPRSQSRPLLPEEMDSIRRILSRNLHNFNNKVSPSLPRPLPRLLPRPLVLIPRERQTDPGLQPPHAAPGGTRRPLQDAPPPAPESGEQHPLLILTPTLGPVCSSSPRPVELDSPTSRPAGQPCSEDQGPAAEDQSPPEHQQPPGGRLPKKQLSVAFVNEKQA